MFSACDSSWPCGTSPGLHWGVSCFEQEETKAGEIFDFSNCSLMLRVLEHELCVTGWAIFSSVILVLTCSDCLTSQGAASHH